MKRVTILITMTDINRALNLLKDHQVVGIPTETVYGLAAMIDSEVALKKIFSIKERPFFDPLIVHVTGPGMAKDLCKDWPEIAQTLATKFWPGPLTLVLKKKTTVNDLITAGLDSVGIRCPDHATTLKLIEELAVPLAAPSANKFKQTSPTTAAHVREELKDVYVLDGGSCQVGIESTVCGIVSDDKGYKVEIYRPGVITKKQIMEALKENNITASVEVVQSPVAPGAMKHHYMPAIPLIVLKNDALFETELTKACDVLKLDSNLITELHLPNSSALAARMLYGELRQIAKTKAQAILIKVNKSQETEEWQGITNRLMKAKSYPL